MCIINDPEMLKKERSKTGQLMLWKVIKKDNFIGLWTETYHDRKFHTGNNQASVFSKPGQFHCLPTRDSARRYRKFRLGRIRNVELKIIKVYADRKNIVAAGKDDNTLDYCISVSQIQIKSLKHQR